jgi:8-oxo-(d)GTP phosphatase
VSQSRTAPADIRAAGVVTFRPGREVLLVHRPGYDDWSFPKGKLEAGEHPTAAAAREAAEETGLHVRLGPPLPAQRYSRGRRMKTVRYWTARVVGDDDVSLYRPNDEVDEVAWVTIDKAAEMLTYPMDRELLADAVRMRRKTRALVVLRHGAARSRSAWRGDDVERPLLRSGLEQAARVVPMLAAYDVTRVVSSPALRCLQTVRPYVETTGWEIDTKRKLTEERATSEGIAALVTSLLEAKAGTALCTHRPVLPLVYDALGLRPSQRGEDLEPGEMLVAHVRKGRVVAVERHRP